MFKQHFVVRPTASLLYDLQLLAFGGEFWIWYLVKWAAKACAVFLVVRLLRRYGASLPVVLAITAFLLFHTASFQLMLTSMDGWAALGMLALLNITPDFSISALTKRQYTLFLAALLLTLGVKEVAYVFCGLMAVTFLVREGKKAVIRLVPMAGLLLLWTYLLKLSAGRVQRFSFPAFSARVIDHARMLVPSAPLQIWAILLAFLLVYAAYDAFRNPDRQKAWLCGFCLVAGSAMLLFTSTTLNSAARYVIPSVFLFSIPAGLALSALRVPPAALAAFLFVYPITTLGDLYEQELAYQQLLYECSEMINLLEQKADQGYQLAVTGDDYDIPRENQATIQLFFEQYGPRLYGRPKRLVLFQDNTAVWPTTAFALITLQPPEAIFQRYPTLDEPRLRKVEHTSRGDYGVLETLAKLYGRLDAAIGNQHIGYYDIGAPISSFDPKYYVYTFGGGSSSRTKLQISNFSAQKFDAVELRPRETHRFGTKAGETWSWKIAVGKGVEAQKLRYSGSVQVEKGHVGFGLTNREGRDVWNTMLETAPGLQALPRVPLMPLKPNEEYFLFFFATKEAVQFTLRDFQVDLALPMETIPRQRRYGAIMR